MFYLWPHNGYKPSIIDLYKEYFLVQGLELGHSFFLTKISLRPWILQIGPITLLPWRSSVRAKSYPNQCQKPQHHISTVSAPWDRETSEKVSKKKKLCDRTHMAGPSPKKQHLPAACPPGTHQSPGVSQQAAAGHSAPTTTAAVLVELDM